MNFNNSEIFELPLVITRGYVGYPGSQITLAVERKFSVGAVKVSTTAHSSYCIVVSQKDLEKENISSFEDIYSIGVLSQISNIENTKTGLRAKFVHTDRVQIDSIRFDNDTFYATARMYPDILGDNKEEVSLITNIIKKIQSDGFENFFRGNGQGLNEQLAHGINATELSYFLANRVSVAPKAKQDLLEANTVNDRLLKVLVALNEMSELNDIDRKIMQTVQQNTDKQQKEYLLREKIRAIKKELGEDPSKDSTSTIEKLENNPYPEEVKTKIKDELKRKEMMPQGSLEASLIQDYIDIVFSIPWFEQTEDDNDIDHAKAVLDEDHYGLVQVKERIIEYLCVKKFKGNLKAPILCFYGPPGCGKTSLSRSIARALGRKFIKCSLGGVSDEAEIRGHRRTYVGSRPGRIINSLRKVKVNNPVFLLDEIDKLGRDSFKGDPSSALLEVLDPEQNKEFADNYLEISYDLSNVLFICTANNIENIPAPLLDRLELIHVPSYTAIDKLHIATDFLIKKQLDANGLKEGSITFDDESIYYIIDRYTREAGVRDLERNIASIIRKVIVEKVKDGLNTDFKVNITIKDVIKYLGVEPFDSTSKEKGKQVGVVTGLAYTDYGGDILAIEVNYFAGKGRLVLTGKLGDVMKESCEIALDYVKANAEKYDIDPQIFDKIDIHVHVPEGAIPKDGPSAGVAITCAIISSLSKKPVSGDIAMTGEVTLRGNALPIGGLREKSLAAMRSGIKKIIIPDGNKHNVSELPKEITEKLKIVYMKNVDDAVKVIFK